MRRPHPSSTILPLALLILCLTTSAQTGQLGSLSTPATEPTAVVSGELELSGVPGSDICVKLQNALALLPKQGGGIDGTMFTGDQPCSANPFSGLRPFSNEFHPWIRLGPIDIQTSVPWVVLSTVVLTGVNSNGNYTRIDYVGASTVPAVMTMGQFTTLDDAHSIFGATVSNILFTSSHGTAEDGFLIESTHHSEFNNLSAWGMTNCGLETRFAVTDTFNRPKVSALDAKMNGYRSPAASPKHDLCFGGRPGYQTTDGTVIDPAAEGSTVSGIWLSQAASMTFLSGTAEGNRGIGVKIDDASADNTFIGTDLESNSGGDISDGGNSTQWMNIIATGRVFFSHSCARARIIGGNHKTPSSESPNCPAQLDDRLFQNLDSSSLVRFVGSLTTTAATTTNLAAPGVKAGALCSVTAQNSIGAGLNGTFVPPVVSDGKVVVFHQPVAGATFSVFCQ